MITKLLTFTITNIGKIVVLDYQAVVNPVKTFSKCFKLNSDIVDQTLWSTEDQTNVPLKVASIL